MTKHLLIVLVVLCAPVASGQQKPAPPFQAVEGAFFALSVPDLDASVGWYSEKLALTVGSRFSTDDGAGALLSGHGLDVELMALKGSVPRTDPFDKNTKQRPQGIVKVGFRVTDLDRTLAALRSRGVEVVLGPFPPRRDQRANVLVRDNSGNLIQLFGAFAP